MKPFIQNGTDKIAPLPVEVRDPKLLDILDIESGLEQVVTGFDFLEGPVWQAQDQAVIFSDIMGNSLYRWSVAEQSLSQIRRNSHMANGNTFDQHGRLLTCEHATSRVSRTDFDGGISRPLASHYEGKELNSPNDIVVKRDGMIYFTDPTSGRSAGYGVPREPELDFAGVYRLNPQTGELNLLVDDFDKPNGLCFSQDESLLYVNDTTRQHIRVFDVTAEGLLENGRLFAELTGDKDGVADGMKVDTENNVYTCGPGGIQIFTADGTCLGVIEMPEKTANFVFGDGDLSTLYITASTSLYRLRTKVAGTVKTSANTCL